MILFKEAYKTLSRERIAQLLDKFFNRSDIKELIIFDEEKDDPVSYKAYKSRCWDVVNLWNKQNIMLNFDFYKGNFTTGAVDSDYGIISGEEKNAKISISVNTRFFTKIYKEGIDTVAKHLLPAIAHGYIHYQRDILSKGRSQNNYLSSDSVSWFKYASQPEEIASFAVQIVEEFILNDYPIDVIIDIISGSRPWWSGNSFLDEFRRQFRDGKINSKLYHKFLRTAYDYAVKLKKEGVNIENPQKWDVYWDKVGKSSPNVKPSTFIEFRTGDTSVRAGLIITDGQYLLTCKPTPSSRWPNPKLDIPKGHVQSNENACHAAIRECFEETNILFETWKLNCPMQFTMEGEPLYLWKVHLSEMPPIEKLSCASTFIDDTTGQRKPEMAGYEYISLFDAQFHGAFSKLQDRLRPCVESYFNSKITYPFEDYRICADKINLPDGLYTGIHTAYYIKLDNGISFKTVCGVKGRNIPTKVIIHAGFVYKGDHAY
jgi:8-oxo-dGTP pyrophosphatase MutT (NUDIX family)